MILHLNDKIDQESLTKLITAVNDANEKGERLTIYMNSSGGGTSTADAMAKVINEYNSVKGVTLIGYGNIGSAAFDLFFDARCLKMFAGGVVGMYHMGAIEIFINEKNKPTYHEDKAKINYIKGYSRVKTSLLCARLGMTKAEIDGINKGEDVWFSVERMNEFLQADSDRP